MMRALRSRLAMSAMIAAVAVAVAGCDRPQLSDAFHPEVTDYTKRHPIVVTPQSETIDIAVGRSGAARDYAYMETTRFLRQYKRSTSGALYISLPGHDAGASNLIGTAIQREGIPAQRVNYTRHGAAGTLTLSYDRVAAIGPVCGNWQEDVTRNPDRAPYPDFGCSQQRAIAAMAANPTDLAYPARETPRIGAERPGAPAAAKSGSASGSGDPGAAPAAAASPALAPPASTP